MFCCNIKLYFYEHFDQISIKLTWDLMHLKVNFIYNLGFMSHAPIQLLRALKRLKGHINVFLPTAPPTSLFSPPSSRNWEILQNIWSEISFCETSKRMERVRITSPNYMKEINPQIKLSKSGIITISSHLLQCNPFLSPLYCTFYTCIKDF